MKKALFAFMTFLQFSLMAYADNFQGRPYVGGLVGANWMNEKHYDFNTGYKVGAFAGYKFTSWENPLANLRLEGEISYRHNALRNLHESKSSYRYNASLNPDYHSKKAHLHGYRDSLNIMANAYYDIETGSRWTPYLGVGLGWVYSKEHGKVNLTKINGYGGNHSHTSTDNNFASQYIGGVAYEIEEGVHVGAEYRYLIVNKHADEQVAALTLKRYF